MARPIPDPDLPTRKGHEKAHGTPSKSNDTSKLEFLIGQLDKHGFDTPVLRQQADEATQKLDKIKQGFEFLQEASWTVQDSGEGAEAEQEANSEIPDFSAQFARYRYAQFIADEKLFPNAKNWALQEMEEVIPAAARSLLMIRGLSGDENNEGRTRT